MKVVVAPGCYKQSCDADRAGRALAAGVRDEHPDAEVVIVPLADGGLGTAAALATAARAPADTDVVTVDVRGPLGEPTRVRLHLEDGDRRRAWFDAAAACGLHLVPEDRRDPLAAGSAGVGEAVRACAERGAAEVILGLGDTAVCDLGAGAAAALGARFLDDRGRPFTPTGGTLERVARVERVRAGGPRLVLLADVRGPLTGPHGAAAVYGPQKGADPRAVERLDTGLAHLAAVIARDTGVDPAASDHGACAGGMAAGMAALATPAAAVEVLDGAPAVVAAVGLDDALRGADLLITGEGRLDAQTPRGKAAAAAAEAARRAGVPAWCVPGRVGADAGEAQALFAGVRPLAETDADAARTTDDPESHLRRAAAAVVREAA